MEDMRTIRRQLGLSQIELADQLGLHQSTVSRMEGGSLEIDGRTRLALEALIARQAAAAPQDPKDADQAQAAA